MVVVLTREFATKVRFWGWSENKREEEKDFAELSQLAREGKPLYGESPQPLWVQSAAHSNSAFSQLKFSEYLNNPTSDMSITLTSPFRGKVFFRCEYPYRAGYDFGLNQLTS
jgi:hypothetical protein